MTANEMTITERLLQSHLEILRALRIARESLKDVLRHGAGPRQCTNIKRHDLPTIEGTIESAEHWLEKAGQSVKFDEPDIGAIR